MTRRRAVVLASAFTMLALGIIVTGIIVAVTQTDYGRGKIRAFVLEQLAPSVHGKLYVGRLGGSLLTGITIDSVEIRDPSDSLFVSTGRITIEYDPRDLWDKRVLLKRVEVEHPVVVIRKDSTDTWNWRRVFPSGPPSAPKAERGFGDYIVIDSALVSDASVILTLAWAPHDSLRGARRDSAIAENLARTDTEIRRSGSFFTHSYRWSNANVALSAARIADPDSAGQSFTVARLDVDESSPPFDFRNARGLVTLRGDSLWFDLPHFDLPGSTGSGRGKVVWGSDLPIRYDLAVVGDSVSMSDVSWVYPTLPTTGGGRMKLAIRNERDLSVIDYAITDMDVRTTRSRLTGAMTFGVGDEVLIVKDVDVRADPMNWDLLRTLNGKEFPFDWQGDLVGTVKARGGPVNRFVVDDARLEFRDANVPGAVSSATARGDLDILFPAFTAFRALRVDVARLDLRTIEYVNPAFPRLGGWVSGSATLDSSWLDVRFRNADLTHHDGPGEPTRMTGNGRATYGEKFITYDLALNAEPLSFSTLARSYPKLPITGSYAGPLRVQGTLEDLAVVGELRGPAGVLAIDARVDGDPPTYGFSGTAQLTNVNLATLLDSATLGRRAPTTALSARFLADVRGDSLATLAGSASMDLERSEIDGIRFYPSRAAVAFAGGHLRVDTLQLESVAGTLAASGGIGLERGVTDSLVFRLRLDSLGGVRQYLADRSADSTRAAALLSAAGDSLGGSVELAGTVRGAIDDFTATGALDAQDLWRRGESVRRMNGTFTFRDSTDAISGRVVATLDTARVGGVGIDRATADVRAIDRSNFDYALDVAASTGPSARASGTLALRGDTTLVALDTLRLTLGRDVWHLERPAHVLSSRELLSIDSIALRASEAGAISLAGTAPVSGPVALDLRADNVALRDVGAIAQTTDSLGGRLTFEAHVRGTRAEPTIAMRAAIDSVSVGGVRLDRVNVGGSYAAKRLDATLELARAGQRILQASARLPMDLALAPTERRLLDAPMEGRIHSEQVGLELLEAFSPEVRDARGAFSADLALGGTWGHETLTGDVRVDGGELAIATLGKVRFRDITADIGFVGDSIAIRRASATTRDERAGTVSLTGGLNGWRTRDPRFDLTLRAHDLHAIDNPRIAHLDISTDLRLHGAYSGSTLSGEITVARGSIYIPELLTKQVISLDDEELYRVVDTTVYANRSLIPKAPPELVRNLAIENVQVRMGDDVWLRSAEANINLGGSLNVTVGRGSIVSRAQPQLALDGSLLTNRGQYRLDLGVVQRTFQVESGQIRFFNDPDFNPTLDISAVYTVNQLVSQYAKQDVRIRVRIGGTLARPQLALSSADSLGLSESDLLSYLVAGQPSFAIGGQAATSVLVGTVSSIVGGRLQGGLFDVVQLETASDIYGPSTESSSANNSFGERLFSRARLGLGKQLGDRTFVTLTAGLCQLGNFFGTGSQTAASSNQNALQSFTDQLGVKVEQRLNAGYGLSASIEPATDNASCQASSGRSSFLLTPKQYGLDLFRTWRF